MGIYIYISVTKPKGCSRHLFSPTDRLPQITIVVSKLPIQLYLYFTNYPTPLYYIYKLPHPTILYLQITPPTILYLQNTPPHYTIFSPSIFLSLIILVLLLGWAMKP